MKILVDLCWVLLVLELATSLGDIRIVKNVFLTILD